jgi:hypothetical protein
VTWQSQDSGEWDSNIVIAADGTLYAHDGARHGVMAIATDGSTRWTTPIATPSVALQSTLSGSVNPSLAIAVDGTVYAWNGALTAIRLDGAVTWTWQLPPTTAIEENSFDLTVGPDGTVYVVDVTTTDSGDVPPVDTITYGGRLFAVDAGGHSRWSKPLAAGFAPADSPTIGQEGAIYVPTVSADGSASLVTFSPAGEVIWTASLGNSGAGGSQGPSGDGFVVVGDDGTGYAVCWLADPRKPNLCAFGPDGSSIASLSIGLPLTPTLLLAPSDGLVLVNLASGLQALTGPTLAPAWSVDDWWGSITDGRGVIYGQLQSELAAVDGGGHMLWSAPSEVIPVAIDAKGTGYGAGPTGLLYGIGP